MKKTPEPSKNIMEQLIKKKYPTLTAFAEDAGISKAHASQLVHKKAKPSVGMYKKIEQVLGEEVRSHFF